MHPLADLILAEGKRMGAGTTIKTDGEESDPWGVLAAVDIRRCQVSNVAERIDARGGEEIDGDLATRHFGTGTDVWC